MNRQIIINTVGGNYSIAYLQECTICFMRSYYTLFVATKDIQGWLNFNKDPIHGKEIK